MRTLRSLPAAAVVALLGNGYAGAHTPVEITYVAKSLARLIHDGADLEVEEIS